MYSLRVQLKYRLHIKNEKSPSGFIDITGPKREKLILAKRGPKIQIQLRNSEQLGIGPHITLILLYFSTLSRRDYFLWGFLLFRTRVSIKQRLNYLTAAAKTSVEINFRNAPLSDVHIFSFAIITT